MNKFVFCTLLSLGLAFAQDRTASGTEGDRANHPMQPTKKLTPKLGTADNPLVVRRLDAEETTERRDQMSVERSEKAAIDKSVASWTSTLAAATIVLAVVAGAQLAMFWMQLGIMRKGISDGSKVAAAAKISADAAKESADVAIAAVMPVLSPRVIGGNLHPLTMPPSNQPVTFQSSVHFVFENFGKMAGSIKELRADLFLTDKDGLPEVNFDKIPTMNYTPTIPGDARGEDAVMGAAELVKLVTISTSEYRELLAEAKGQYRRYALIGRVIYDDLIGLRHTRRFCVKLRKMGDKGLFQLVSGGSHYNQISRERVPDPDPLETPRL